MNEENYELVAPFWIDTDAYSDRDRLLFTSVYEFASILKHICYNSEPLSITIHRENESRIRLTCARFNRTCKINQCDLTHDPDHTWSFLDIEAK